MNFEKKYNMINIICSCGNKNNFIIYQDNDCSDTLYSDGKKAIIIKCKNCDSTKVITK